MESGDIPAMVFWSLPLSLLVYFTFRGLLRRIVFASAPISYLVLTLTGAVLGIASTAIALLFLGGWIFAFGFPVLYCWVIGGALAGITASLLSTPSRWPVAFALSVAFVLLAMFAFPRLESYANSPEPQVRVTLKPGLSPQDEQRFWTEVIANPDKSENGLLEGVSGGAVGGHENGSAIFIVTLRRHLSDGDVASVLTKLRSSPLVHDVRQLSTND